MAKNISIKTINKWDNLKCQKSMYSVTVEPQIRRHPFGGISVSFAGFINNKSLVSSRATCKSLHDRT